MITSLGLDNALKNNGGSTQTIALLPNSPAIDFIPPDECVDQSSPTPLPVTTDQRGFARPDPSETIFPEQSCDIGAFESGPADIAIGNAKVQVVLTGNQSTNRVNLNTTFTNNGTDNQGCAGDDALHDGFAISVQAGTCAGVLSGGFIALLDPFVVHTIGHQSYGTFFETFGVGGSISAKLTTLPTPAGACGQWNLNLEGVGLGVSGFARGTPLALLIFDSDGQSGCFDVPAKDTIIGVAVSH